MDKPLLHAATNYWVPSRHVFCFNGIKICPTIEEFSAIMGEPEINDLIFPTMGRDLLSLLRVVLGVLAATANRWCVFEKLDLQFLLKPILFLNDTIRFEFSSWRFILFR